MQLNNDWAYNLVHKHVSTKYDGVEEIVDHKNGLNGTYYRFKTSISIKYAVENEVKNFLLT